MYEPKTRETGADVADFLDTVPNAQRRADAKIVCAMMERLSGQAPRMWGPSMIGFGRYHYKYASGHEGNAMRIGFSPRSNALVLYVLGAGPRQDAIMARLGKYTNGKSCLYVKKLSDVDPDALEELIAASLDHMRETYPET